MGDVLTCSAEEALSYRWTNVHHSGDAKIYGKTLSISRPGRFNYECTVFMDCGSGVFCPFTGGISGYARGRVYGFTALYMQFIEFEQHFYNVKLNQQPLQERIQRTGEWAIFVRF